MDHILNHDRFSQNVNFNTFPASATDIDGLIHAKGKCFLFLEAKVEGIGLPTGQEILARDLVQSLGHSKPAFFAVAHHDTRASEDITGDNMLVSKVFASAPHMNGKVAEHAYINRPTWRNFATDTLMATDAARILHPYPTLHEGGEAGDILTKMDTFLWTAAENEHLMQEYADLDCVDEEDMSAALWDFVNSFGFTEETEGNIVLMFDTFVFNNWVMNRHLLK